MDNKKDLENQLFQNSLWMIADEKHRKTIDEIYRFVCKNIAQNIKRYSGSPDNFLKFYRVFKKMTAQASKMALSKSQAAFLVKARHTINKFGISRDQLRTINKQFRKDGKIMRIPMSVIEYSLRQYGIVIYNNGKTFNKTEHHFKIFLPSEERLRTIFEVGESQLEKKVQKSEEAVNEEVQEEVQSLSADDLYLKSYIKNKEDYHEMTLQALALSDDELFMLVS